MIPKVTLKDLYKDTFRRSALIAIPNISEMLEVDSSAFHKWEIFYTIVKDALKDFEYHYPLSIVQRTWIDVDSQTRVATLTDNFEGYLNGILSEDQIFILPSDVVSISTSYYTVSTYPLRNFIYVPPRLTEMWYGSGVYFTNCVCRRPFFEEYDPVTLEPTDRCAVYYLCKDSNTEYNIFRDEVFCKLGRYLLNVKKNMMLQGMPIELFGGLEEEVQKIEGKLENIYQSALTSSNWII